MPSLVKRARGNSPSSGIGNPLPGGVAAHTVEQERREAVGELVRFAAGTQPGIRPVRGREREQRRGRVVEIRAQLAELAALAEERAESPLIAAALRDAPLAPRSLAGEA